MLNSFAVHQVLSRVSSKVPPLPFRILGSISKLLVHVPRCKCDVLEYLLRGAASSFNLGLPQLVEYQIYRTLPMPPTFDLDCR